MIKEVEGLVWDIWNTDMNSAEAERRILELLRIRTKNTFIRIKHTDILVDGEVVEQDTDGRFAVVDPTEFFLMLGRCSNSWRLYVNKDGSLEIEPHYVED